MKSHTILQSKLATVGGFSDEQTDAEVRAEMAFFLPLFISMLMQMCPRPQTYLGSRFIDKVALGY